LFASLLLAMWRCAANINNPTAIIIPISATVLKIVQPHPTALILSCSTRFIFGLSRYGDGPERWLLWNGRKFRSVASLCFERVEELVIIRADDKVLDSAPCLGTGNVRLR
jgi:hypothetical protein